MTRAVRRADIPLWYTEGFNKHPYLTFAAPLSLGYEGLRETMDIRMADDFPFDELVKRLNAVLPEGLVAISAADVVAKAGDLAAAEYRLTIHLPVAIVTEALSRSELLVEKRTKKKTMKTMDILPYFKDAVVETAGEDTTVVTVSLPSGSNENINPGLFVTALKGITGTDVDAEVLRLRLLLADGSEFL
jgi:radical SAM-linked protein